MWGLRTDFKSGVVMYNGGVCNYITAQAVVCSQSSHETYNRAISHNWYEYKTSARRCN